MKLHEALTGAVRSILAASLGALAMFSLAPAVAAAEVTAAGEASASLAIVDPVGAGFSYDIANDAGRLLETRTGIEAQLPHGEENAPMHRLEAVACIR